MTSGSYRFLTNISYEEMQTHFRYEGIGIYLGSFDTPEEAHLVYIAKKRELHPSSML